MNKKVSVILPYYNRKTLLINTLDSFSMFYENNNLEVVIVDDCSSEDQRLEEFVKKYQNLKIILIRLDKKDGINPCYTYNVGVRYSTGEIVILTSPETFHTSNMFDISNNFSDMKDNSYLLFSVFCLTKSNLKEKMWNENIVFKDKLQIIKDNEKFFFKDLGCNGYPYNNNYGSWYLHSNIRPTGLNFFSALTRNLYNELSGFDERFRYGTGCDDEEFRIRVFNSVRDIIYYDSAVAIHVDHEIVKSGDQVSNKGIFKKTRIDMYKKNDNWGLKK